MVDRIGAAAGNLGGIGGGASIERQWWYAIPHEPAEVDTSPTTGPMLYVEAQTWEQSVPTVLTQLQVSLDPAFGTTVHDTTVAHPRDVPYGRQILNLVDGQTYYWRARAGAGGNWGWWSEPRSLLIELDSGKAFLQMSINVGVTAISDRDAVLSTSTNVGFEDRRRKTWPVYSMLNVGVPAAGARSWAVYAMQNTTEGTPNPRIWFIRPAYGRSGDGIEIVGWGFGDLQSTFSGVVEMDYGGEVGWVPVTVASWQTFPADPPAYTDDRVLDEQTSIIDPMHTVIGFVVPADAVPPGYPIRVRTDGP